MSPMLALISAGLLVAPPLPLQDSGFRGRNGAFTIEFTDIQRRADTQWDSASVTFNGPDTDMTLFAAFEGTDGGVIENDDMNCRITITTLSDEHGYDAGWTVALEPTDDEEEGCDQLDPDLAGDYEAY